MAECSDMDFIPSAEFAGAFQRFVGEVFRLNGQLLSTAESLSRDLEVSTARWQTIAVIRDEPMTVAAISRRLGLTRQSVQQTVNRLRDQDIIAFVENPDHRRSPLVRLTAHGKAVMRTLHERQVRLAAHFTDGMSLTIEEIDGLTHQLRRMREHARRIDTSEFVGSQHDNA